jgi:hypothetical protein
MCETGKGHHWVHLHDGDYDDDDDYEWILRCLMMTVFYAA